MPARICRRLLVIPIGLFAFSLSLDGSALAKPATLCVNPGGTAGCFSKIQDAVDASGKSGSVVRFPFGMSIVGKQLIVDDQGNSRFLIFSTQ